MKNMPMNTKRVGMATVAGLGVALSVFIPVSVLFEHQLSGWRQLLLLVPSLVVGGVSGVALYRGLGDEVSSRTTRIAKSVAGFGTALLVGFLLLGVSARLETLPTIGATQALVLSVVLGIVVAGLMYSRESP